MPLDAAAHAREKEWAETDTGRLFWRFDSALQRAVYTDCRDSATRASLERDWGRADAARAAFLKALRGW